MNYQDALTWLYSLQRFGIKLGLENIQRLIAELHVDLAGARVVHVAGTNGKGSVCAMIDSICRAQNYRTGLFTSPHLITFRERIRVSGEMISKDAVAGGLTSICNLVATWDPYPTFFEVTTALALKYFSDTKLDIVILETGLGGRLDATNAMQSNVSIITPIDLDHQQWLGDSLKKIAFEKAGIIKPGIPVVSAPQKTEVEAVVRKRAGKCGAPIEFVNAPHEQHPIALIGAQQKLNAALAIAAIRAVKIDPLRAQKAAGSQNRLDRPAPSGVATQTDQSTESKGLPAESGSGDIDDSAIARGLATVDWPARFQKWDEHTIIDGAHNPAAAQTLAETWRENFGDQRATLILAILADKDLLGICEALAPIADSVLLPKIRSERAAPPEELAKVLSSITPSLPNASPVRQSDGLVPWRARTSITKSLAEALDQARAKPHPILLTGSLHFAGEALAYLQGQPAAFEECAQ